MIYVDTSALTKLLVAEAESVAMRELAGTPMITSALTAAELRRAVRRRAPSLAVDVEHVLERLTTVAIDAQLLRAAGAVGPVELKTLDAIHLATAMAVRDDITAFVAYDERLLDAARLAGIPTLSPGV